MSVPYSIQYQVCTVSQLLHIQLILTEETGNQYECPVQYTVSGLYCVPAVTHPAYTDIGNKEPV